MYSQVWTGFISGPWGTGFEVVARYCVPLKCWGTVVTKSGPRCVSSPACLCASERVMSYGHTVQTCPLPCDPQHICKWKHEENIIKRISKGFWRTRGVLVRGLFLTLFFLKAKPFTLSPRKAAHQSHHLWMRATTHSSVHEGRHGVRNSWVLHLLADAAPFKCFRKWDYITFSLFSRCFLFSQSILLF